MPAPHMPEDNAPGHSRSDFSSAAELQHIAERGTSHPNIRRRLRRLALGAAGAAVLAASATAAVLRSGGEKQDPAWTPTPTQPNLPTTGSPEDTSYFSSQLENDPTLPSSLATFELGEAADEHGILAVRNPVVLVEPDRIILGVTTDQGLQSFVLDREHYQIGVMEGEDTGPLANSFEEAKQLLMEYWQKVAVEDTDVVVNGNATSSLVGDYNNPDSNTAELGVVLRYTLGADDELTATQG
jgi:hypothetical protein